MYRFIDINGTNMYIFRGDGVRRNRPEGLMTPNVNVPLGAELLKT